MIDNDAFIEQLLIKADPNIDDDALDLLIEDVQPVLFDRVINSIGAQLSDEQLGTFTALAEGDADEKQINDFLKKAIPDHEAFMAKVYDDFEEMYLTEYRKFKKEKA